MKLIETDKDWTDDALDPSIVEQLQSLVNWYKYRESPNNLFAKKVGRSYRAVFYGSPDATKKIAAALVGKSLGQMVYEVDLSTIVSKYIGETEKNLENLFATAENKNWVLFFDEADALFGKRTDVKDSHDRFANLEVAYLMQRIEDYNGMVILASNTKSNIDPAFIRRFHAVIYFPSSSTAA